MAKYLLLKHYRGAPAPVNDVPMEQWTPEERSAHGPEAWIGGVPLSRPRSMDAVDRPLLCR